MGTALYIVETVMKKNHLILAVFLLFGACKKNHDQQSAGGSNVPPYFEDILINETLANGSNAPFQRALGYFPLASDPGTQIMVASRGSEELNDARGFRIASINNSKGTVNWVSSFDLPDQYFIQIATCAAIDANDNIWIGGHSFQGITPANLFLVKLDRSGNLIWSKSFSNYQGFRAYSLAALSNGDIALFGKSGGAMVCHRLTADGNPVWSTQLVYTWWGTIDDDYYNKPNNLSPENHGLVEGSDGSIYFATSSNSGTANVGGTDRLVRLDANGKILFANVYSLANNTAVVRPVQLTAAGNGQLLLADQMVSYNGWEGCPYFTMLSGDGSVVASRGRPYDPNNVLGITINEVNFYHDSVYYSTCGDNQFNTYILDAGLNLKSAVKTAATSDIGTDRGGISLYDATDRALYYVFNFGGNPGESNGFEVTRNGPTGKPCVTTYTIPPATLLLESTTVSVKADTAVASSGYGPSPVFTSLTWRQYTVTTSPMNVCGQ